VKKTYSGQCHCGAIRFEVSADLEVEKVLDCNCSICRRKGFLHLIVAPEDFELITGLSHIREYRFNTMQAVHKFCEVCGVHPFYSPRSHPGMVDINLNCLDGVTREDVEIEFFDGSRWEESASEKGFEGK